MTDIFFKALYTIQFLCKVAWLPKYTKLIYKTWGTEFFIVVVLTKNIIYFAKQLRVVSWSACWNKKGCLPF